jgi:murein DD-endopeptidase MepM/ murein hydrolase activator NlpD
MWIRFWNKKIVQILAIIAAVIIVVLLILNLALRTINTNVSNIDKKQDKMISQLAILVTHDSLQTIKDSTQDKILAHIPELSPIASKDIKGISSKFGDMRQDTIGKVEFHSGLDIRAAKGTVVVAMADGVVVAAGYDDGWGERVLINHLEGHQTAYSHLLKIFVKKGEIVHKGEVIGQVGNTGNSTGPHLDLRVYYSGKPINPNLFF